MVEQIEKLVSMFERGQLDRRQLIGGFVATLGAPTAAAATGPALFEGRQVNHVTLSVSDLERSRAFYERLVGAKVMYEGPKHGQPVYDMRLADGTSFISVAATRSGVAPHINHVCVGIRAFDADRAEALLKKEFPGSDPRATSTPAGAPEPIRWRSVNLKDPDGIGIQLGDVKFQLDGRH
jgi:catechol 2,3-dioxygenase-like lactoylglutathione lyase family enzyme